MTADQLNTVILELHQQGIYPSAGKILQAAGENRRALSSRETELRRRALQALGITLRGRSGIVSSS